VEWEREVTRAGMENVVSLCPVTGYSPPVDNSLYWRDIFYIVRKSGYGDFMLKFLYKKLTILAPQCLQRGRQR
jgi:hypothetical protein